MTRTTLNKSSGNNTWLILSYSSNADGRAASLHIDNRLPYLKKNGILTVILSGPNFPRHSSVPHFRVPSFAPSGIWFEVRTFINRFVKAKVMRSILKLFYILPLAPFYLLEKVFITIESQWSWFLPAAVRGSRLVHRYRVELIYSTGGSISAHVAACILARFHNLPWIAEFQDPLVHDDWQRSKRALKLYGSIERLVCARADVVVFLTEKARDRAVERTSLGDRGRVIYPGAKPPDEKKDVHGKGEICRFVHVGSLANSRNLKVFLEAMALFVDENPGMELCVRLELYGTCDHLSREAIAVFPVQEMIRDFGRVSHKEALAVMNRADVLLLIQDTKEFSSETIPSKSYEYFHAGRPILGLVYKNRELGNMLVELGHQAVDATSVQDVKNGITRIVEQWRSDRISPQTSPYTVEAAVESLVSVANQALRHTSRGEANYCTGTCRAR